MRRTVVAYLFPALRHTIHASVHDGVLTLRGGVRDPAPGWVAERLVRAVEGVVDVHARLGDGDAAPGPGDEG